VQQCITDQAALAELTPSQAVTRVMLNHTPELLLGTTPVLLYVLKQQQVAITTA